MMLDMRMLWLVGIVSSLLVTLLIPCYNRYETVQHGFILSRFPYL